MFGQIFGSNIKRIIEEGKINFTGLNIYTSAIRALKMIKLNALRLFRAFFLCLDPMVGLIKSIRDRVEYCGVGGRM